MFFVLIFFQYNKNSLFDLFWCEVVVKENFCAIDVEFLGDCSQIFSCFDLIIWE